MQFVCVSVFFYFLGKFFLLKPVTLSDSFSLSFPPVSSILQSSVAEVQEWKTTHVGQFIFNSYSSPFSSLFHLISSYFLLLPFPSSHLPFPRCCSSLLSLSLTTFLLNLISLFLFFLPSVIFISLSLSFFRLLLLTHFPHPPIENIKEGVCACFNVQVSSNVHRYSLVRENVLTGSL